MGVSLKYGGISLKFLNKKGEKGTKANTRREKFEYV
jgi:hypothetical protein